jgi:hypothetical protein
MVMADRTNKHSGSSATPPSASLHRERRSNSEVGGRNREVRCAPVNGHRQADLACPKSAKAEVNGFLFDH